MRNFAFLRRLAILSVLMLAALSVDQARAEVKTFGLFTVEIPRGWTAEFNNDDEADNQFLYLIREDQKAVLGFGLGALEGQSFKELMDFMAKEPNPGSGRPQPQPDGSYRIEAVELESGLHGREIYRAFGSDHYSVEAVYGQHADIDKIVKSFKLAAPPAKK